MASNPYTRYHYSTDELVKRFKPSLSNTFDVSIRTPGLKFGPSGSVSWSDIHFMAYEAVLPGTSYELGAVYGDRQGRTEQYPTKRVYPPVDVSFYVDQDYQAIRFFEAWINTISSNKGSNSDSFVTHNYPDSYEGEVTITKYERNTRPFGTQLLEANKSTPIPGNVIKYTLRNAFPSNLISIPVSYDGAQILKTTVTFNYDVYFFELKSGIENADEVTGQSSGDQTDPPAAATFASGGLGATLPETEFPDGYPGLQSLQEQLSEIREMRLRSQNRSGSPVTPALQGPPAPIN